MIWSGGSLHDRSMGQQQESPVLMRRWLTGAFDHDITNTRKLSSVYSRGGVAVDCSTYK